MGLCRLTQLQATFFLAKLIPCSRRCMRLDSAALIQSEGTSVLTCAIRLANDAFHRLSMCRYHNSGDLSDRPNYDFDQIAAIAKVMVRLSSSLR